MQFRHPEILYFLFLLIIPILVHLFQLRRFKKQYFTNVRFLKALSIQTRKSSKIKKWLLLATRLLLLAAIIIAFAQPFFPAKDSISATNEMYVILDNSFSMQAKGQKGELLKRAVEDLLEHAPEGQTFSLITNSETYWNTDIKSVQRDLQQLKYSATPFNLQELMANVNANKSTYNKDIVIITDAVGLEQSHLKNVLEADNAYLIIPEAEQKTNAAIDSVFISEVLENFYKIGVKLSAVGDLDNDVSVALYNKGKLIAKTMEKLKQGSKTITFNIPKDDFHGYVSIQDNGLSYDNMLYFSLAKASKINVLAIGDADKSGFLGKIYTPGEFSFSNFALNALDYNLIQKQDVVIVNELDDIPQALQTTLKTFAEKGGNIILIPAANANVSNLNAFIGNFGSTRFGSVQPREKLISKIAFGHPLYAGVFEKRTENFQYPKTKSSFALSGNSPAALAYDDDSSFLTSIGSESSMIYVFAAALNSQNSNFQNSPLIVPTFYNMAQNSSTTGISAITIGDAKPVIVDALLSKDQIVEVRSADESFIPVQQVQYDKVRLTFADAPQQAGNFGVYNDDQLLKNISFNYARTEGNLQAADLDLPDNFKSVEDIEDIFNTLRTSRTNNDIWKLFVVLALIFLAAEIFIQKFVK
ncbi:MAG TPA: BatA and WFA domain-containing protein [Flavobacterium sp.]|jgi:hypothetical protein